MRDGCQAPRPSSELQDEIHSPHARAPDSLDAVNPDRVLHIEARVGEVTTLHLDPDGTELEGDTTPEHDRVLTDIELVVLVRLLALHEAERVEAELRDDRGRVDEAQTRTSVAPEDLRGILGEGHRAVDLGEQAEAGVIEVVAHLAVERPHTRVGVTVAIPITGTAPDQEVVPHELVAAHGVGPELERNLPRVVLPIEEEVRGELLAHEPVAVGTTVTGRTEATVEVRPPQISDAELKVSETVQPAGIDRVDATQVLQVEEFSATLQREPHRIEEVVRPVPHLVAVLGTGQRVRLRERGRSPEEREQKRDQDTEAVHGFSLSGIPLFLPRPWGDQVTATRHHLPHPQ